MDDFWSTSLLVAFWGLFFSLIGSFLELVGLASSFLGSLVGSLLELVGFVGSLVDFISPKERSLEKELALLLVTLLSASELVFELAFGTGLTLDLLGWCSPRMVLFLRELWLLVDGLVLGGDFSSF